MFKHSKIVWHCPFNLATTLQAQVTDMEIVEAGNGVHILSQEFMAAVTKDEPGNDGLFKDAVADNRYFVLLLRQADRQRDRQTIKKGGQEYKRMLHPSLVPIVESKIFINKLILHP